MRNKFVAFFGLLAVLTFLSAAAGMTSARVPDRNQLLNGSYNHFLPVILNKGDFSVHFLEHIIDTRFIVESVFATDMDGDGDVDLLGAGRNPEVIAWL